MPQSASHHSRHQSYWSWDSIQPSTNLYTKPNVIQCTPTIGIPGNDILRLTLTLDDMAILPLLSIALGSCVTPTTSTMIDAMTIELSAIVPEKEHIEDAVDRMPVPVRVIICSARQQQQAQVLDNWLVATMIYSCDIQKQLRTENNNNDGDDRQVGDDHKGKQPAVGRYDTSTSASSRCCFFTVLPTTMEEEKAKTTCEEDSFNMILSSPPPPLLASSTSTKVAVQSAMDPTRYDKARITVGAADYSYPSNNNNDHDDSACSLTTTTPSNMSHHHHQQQQPPSSQDNSNMHPYIISPMQMQAGPAADTVRSVSTPCNSSSSSSPSQQELQQFMDTSIMVAFSRSTPSPSTTTTTQQPATQDIDAYAFVPYKANLHVRGDLNTMVQHWTQEEWQQQRRLVRFWRQQTTGPEDIECTFAPISQSEHPEQASMIVVSCIYWQEMDDFFITSVDCLYLLESLLAVRFTVEEKNRIRRNLEEFKPLTVSRSKVESAPFFRLVMGFPNPRPRNIEKDVKVFPWKSLGQALKKIIGRYTASYSSTASVNFTALACTTSAGSSSYHDQVVVVEKHDGDDDTLSNSQQ